MTVKLIFFSFVLQIGLSGERSYAQKNGSLTTRSKQPSIIISSNGIYNYFTHKTLIHAVNPYGKIPNSNQVAYYWEYKYYDTYTFDLSVHYNRFISKHFSLSAGLRGDQLKSVQKTFVYIDSSSSLPDEKKHTTNDYSISVPLTGHFYLNRFRFSLGLYTYFFSLREHVYLYENNVENKLYHSFFNLWFLGQESIAFKLYKNRAIYLQLGAFHTFDLRDHYGYGRYFTMGLSLEL